MGDNTLINEATTAVKISIATMDVSGTHHEKVVLEQLVSGVPQMIDETNPLHVQMGGTQPISNTYLTNQSGTWGYNAGISGTLTLTGGKRVLKITAIALELAGSFTINGGDVITIPYGASDKVSSSIEFEPMGNVVNPTIIFTNTKAYVVEWLQ